jgi:flagellar hook-length control protein FliK
MPTVAINTTTAAATSSVTSRSAPATPSGNAHGADTASFADQLSQAQLSSDDGNAARANANAAANDAGAHPADAHGADGAAKAGHDDAGERSDKPKAAKDDKAAHRGDADANANATPQGAWPPATPPSTGADAKAAQRTDGKDGDAKGAGRAEKALARRLRDSEAAAGTGSSPTAHHGAAASAADGKHDFQAALAAAGGVGTTGKDKAEVHGSHGDASASPADAALGALAGNGATTSLGTNLDAASAAPPAPANPAGFDAQLSAALGSPEFVPALGVQLSVLAREGVQQARLHLNPAEMGPIAVQIAVDGNTAVVHFQADVAATRQALEAGLPDLAAAMRDSGFTLSGGSVSQQQQQSAGGNGGDAEPGRRGSVGAIAGAGGATASGAGAATPHRLPASAAARLRGGVDLFA